MAGGHRVVRYRPYVVFNLLLGSPMRWEQLKACRYSLIRSWLTEKDNRGLLGIRFGRPCPSHSNPNGRCVKAHGFIPFTSADFKAVLRT